MYGKIFSTMYEGSMVGAGATVFAVMGYAISRQQPPDFNVELNAKLLSAILGEDEEAVSKAIEYLCAPDPGSRSEKEDGRRLIKVGAFTYHMVNGDAYHAIRNYEERKVYNREAQAKYREKKKAEGTPLPEITTRPRFSKPTVDDLISEGMPATEADKFMNHYDSCGWTIGRNKPMKDWKASARGWMSRNGVFSVAGDAVKPNHEMTAAEIVRAAQG